MIDNFCYCCGRRGIIPYAAYRSIHSEGNWRNKTICEICFTRYIRTISNGNYRYFRVERRVGT